MTGERVANALAVLLDWQPEGFWPVLRSYYVKMNNLHTKCYIQELIANLQDLNINQLFKRLEAEVGNKGTEEIVEYLLYNDPSPESPIEEEDLMTVVRKKPFPSYLVGVAYALALEHAQSLLGVFDAILFNLESKKSVYWPELLYDLLSKYLNRGQIGKKAQEWLTSSDDFLRFMGDSLVYELNPVGEEAHDFIDSYQTAIRKSGREDRKKYRKSLRKLKNGEPFWSCIKAY